MYVVLIVIVCGAYGKLQAPEPALTIEMKSYIRRTNAALSKIHDTVGITGANQEHVGPIADYLLKSKNVDVLIASNLTELSDFKTKNLYCFINTINDFEAMVVFIKAAPFFRITGHVHFIIGEAVTDKAWLIGALEYIWRQRILNYAIIFQIGSTIEVIGYNPFSKELLNFTNHKVRVDIFPRKLDDMFDYKIHVGMYDDYPRNKLVNGKLKGEDVKRIEEFCRFSNATLNLTIYRVFDNPQAIMRGDIDFSTNRFFNFKQSPVIISPSYPLSFDYFVILVPTSDLLPNYLYLYVVFDWRVWISILITIIVSIGVKYLLGKATSFKRDSGLVASIFVILKVFLQIAYFSMNKARSSLKIFFMTWTIYSLLIVVAFNATLRDTLRTPKYKEGIQNFDELIKSNIAIITNPSIIKPVMEVFEPIKDKLLYINNTDYLRSNASLKQAILLHKTLLDELVKRRDKSNRHLFQLLPELFCSSHSVYNFPKDSPYASQFRDFTLLDQQHGISKFGIESGVEKVYRTNGQVGLSLNNLQSVFILFAIGNIASCLVFIFEVACWTIKNRTKAHI